MDALYNTGYAGLLREFTAMCRTVLGNELMGVYLHGSAAFGCFDARRSDLDLIVVVENPLPDAAKREFLRRLLPLDEKAPPKGFELSIIRRGVCSPFLFPTPYEFHFSHAWKALALRDPEEYLRQLQGVDPDLAAHFTVTRHCGITLYGHDIPEIFAPVPPECYTESIICDINNAEEDILRDPVYITLNLCRVLGWLRERKILSKQGGGEWGLAQLPAEFYAIVHYALTRYTQPEAELPSPSAAEPEAFAGYMLKEIRAARG